MFQILLGRSTSVIGATMLAFSLVALGQASLTTSIHDVIEAEEHQHEQQDKRVLDAYQQLPHGFDETHRKLLCRNA